jgi:hypothetical protein
VKMPAVEVPDGLAELAGVGTEPARQAGVVDVSLLDPDLLVLEGEKDLGLGIRVEVGLKGELEFTGLRRDVLRALFLGLAPRGAAAVAPAEESGLAPPPSVSAGPAPGPGPPAAAAAAARNAARSSVVSAGWAFGARAPVWHRAATNRSSRALTCSMAVARLSTAGCSPPRRAGNTTAGPVGHRPASSESSRAVIRPTAWWSESAWARSGSWPRAGCQNSTSEAATHAAGWSTRVIPGLQWEKLPCAGQARVFQFL